MDQREQAVMHDKKSYCGDFCAHPDFIWSRYRHFKDVRDSNYDILEPKKKQDRKSLPA
jgi:hypothetical protein